jgi:di/tricarboxylate transporter
MIVVTRGRIATTLRAVAPLAIVAVVATLLLLFPPAQYGFYPRCPIHELFHLQCPGCGATRAIAALLRGDLTEALHLNLLVTLLCPFAVAYGVVCYHRFLQREPLRWPLPPAAAVYTAVVLTTFFTVVRNLPFHSF